MESPSGIKVSIAYVLALLYHLIKIKVSFYVSQHSFVFGPDEFDWLRRLAAEINIALNAIELPDCFAIDLIICLV